MRENICFLKNRAYSILTQKGGAVVTEQLQHAIEALQRLPANAQNTIAIRILEEIEEQEWETIVSKPHVQTRLRELGRKALEEDKVGETEEGDDVI